MQVADEKSAAKKLSPEQSREAFATLGKQLLAGGKELNEIIGLAALHNKWFTEVNIRTALNAIAENFLDEMLLKKWILAYRIEPSRHPEFIEGGRKLTTPFDSAPDDSPKKIALIMAGNVPLAGFHDLLCVLLTGNHALIKMSSKDKHLLPYLLNQLCIIEPAFHKSYEFVEMLKDFDAVIATGSNNSSRYFEYYFGKYPHIIRKNRNSVAVLTGNETDEQLQRLGKDVFLYFGLGCRNVSKLYVPRGYDFPQLFRALEPFHSIIHHHGYKSNFDYNLTLLIMNGTPYHASDFLMLTENKSLASPLASLHFEYYDTLDDAKAFIQASKDEIQCVVAECEIENSISFGKSQQPQFADYADGIDTVRFLLS